MDLSTLYGDRLVRGTLQPTLRQDGTIAAQTQPELKELVEGLTDEELQMLYQRATTAKKKD